MNRATNISFSISNKRYRRKLKSKKKRKHRRRLAQALYLQAKIELEDDFSLSNLIEKWMPINVKFLLSNQKSEFNIEKVTNKAISHRGKLTVPKHFSIVENAKESYSFLQLVLGVLITQKQQIVEIDYKQCVTVGLGAQVLLDIILKDMISFYKLCDRHKKTAPRVKEINGVNIKNENVQKLLFSVGSPAIHSNKSTRFRDIIPYSLCIHDRDSTGDPLEISAQKDIDTTNLVDYVLSCLERMGKSLPPEKLDDLCVVISEILINAEEHSTTKYRFSIGYFHEVNQDGEHYGMFRLVILNFGDTIYEKFNSPNCPNRSVVSKMKKLSSDYTKRNLFFFKTFEEETLWTLYSLQEGVTSIPPIEYKKRGNGSIQFIESFFNIKGSNNGEDSFSKMAILSGNTSIMFDGKYAITERKDANGDNFKYMTFNKSGNIEEKPDSKYVKYVDEYFPGTIISAKILFNEDDVTNEIK